VRVKKRDSINRSVELPTVRLKHFDRQMLNVETERSNNSNKELKKNLHLPKTKNVVEEKSENKYKFKLKKSFTR
jgi:hypothetical protein